MKLRNVEKTEANTAVLTIEVTAEEFEKGLDQAYRKNRKDIQVPGFRKGKAPRKMIEAAYGTSIFYEDGINFTYPQAYGEAVVEADINPVDQPHVELQEFPEEGGYVFTATVTTYPEVTLGTYKGLEAPRKVEEVTEADIDEQLQRLRERNARLVTVEREIQQGDTAVIDFDGSVDGERFKNGQAENYSLEIGSHSFIDTFEDQLVGLKAGDEKAVNVTFPDPYQSPELSGKAAVFQVKVREVKEKQLPELDDDFAQDVSEFDTLEALRNNAREAITAYREKDADDQFVNGLLDQIVENMTVEVPKVLVDNQIDMMVQEQDMMMQQQGMSMEQFAKMTDQTMDIIKESARPSAEKLVKVELALNAIAEQEKLEVTDEDLENEYKAMAEMYKMEADEVKKYVNEADLKSDLLRRKAQEFVKANGVAVEPKEESAEEKPAKKPAARKTTKKAAPKAEEKAETAGEEKAETAGEEKAEEKPAKKPAARKTTKKAAPKAEEPAAEEKGAEQE